MRLILSQILLFAFFSGIVLCPDTAKAGWPWAKKQDCGMEKYSPEWWAYTGSLPVGSRQFYRFGKMWPPRPRPTDPQQTFMQQYHSAHFWPTPYNEMDRNYINTIQEAQVSKGWKNATTLYDYHFNSETHELTKSGREHLLWIMQSAVSHRRAAYVQASTEKYINEQRLASVNNYVNELAGPACSMAVMLDVTSPMSRPAVEVENYQRVWLENMESPHIPYSLEGSGGE
ncbi:hypothetical protein [Rubinisphaera italica]|uniref:Uncharacterized protein n=1 Tax=Rubinisphaera italica TaxID=2527969 RepID=A0A5C5XDQ1_9PLAN|nr:hypothetical protein [Rubinisphaera italica]TWT61130.1 hypothetical protein Pan54_18650 [Rubinisphaera italica]